jgi:uncharacterized OsmC-like protein
MTHSDSAHGAATDSIQGSGYPLGFKLRQGKARPAAVRGETGRDVFLAEARQLAGHQKEGVVHEGATGSVWRMVSDEGVHLKGTDLAPFPLGFYNAGLSSDLANRILCAARARGIAVTDLNIDLHNIYSLTGSFFRGTGEGSAEPAKVAVKIASSAAPGAVTQLVKDAVAASPALASMRLPLTNTFALHVNGRRRAVKTMTSSTAPDAADPFRTYARPPAPLAGADQLRGIIDKTGNTEAGASVPSSADPKTRFYINVYGHNRLLDPQGVTESTLRLGFPGTSHFAIKADERAGNDQAPSGLALISAGIVFCFMTQLSRYIEHMKLNIRNVRVVQSTPFALSGSPGQDNWTGVAEPVDTHLFLSGEESDDMYEHLMHVAARTCYLHAALGAPLPPEVTIEHRSRAAA